MSGIIFFKTANLSAAKEFYEGVLGMKLWKDQGKCLIFQQGSMKLGFCEGEVSETSGTITFVYDSATEVDERYARFQKIATGKPEYSEYYKIYHFWAKDFEGRSLEFQCFMQPEQQVKVNTSLDILNPDKSKPKLLLTRMIPENAVEKLKQLFEVHANTAPRNLSKAELLHQIPEMDALLCLLGDTIDKQVMDAAQKLRVISNYAVGYNNIDTDYAKSRNIAVCNTPGVLTESTADLAWALIMAASRRIAESDRYVRRGKFEGWEPLLMLGQDLHQRTLGILGLGRIGEAVGRRATGFGMKILYYSRTEKSPDYSATKVDLETLLRKSDILSIHAPLTDETKGLLGARELAMMKETAVLINTGRGPIVDEKAMIKALQEKRIFAAGLDVYAQEPFIPQELLDLENVVLLPHIGSASFATRAAMGDMAAENAIAIVKGKQPKSRIV
ncbi:MAG: NAD(P)-dependent oxidoreductase [Candidatus Cloacimonadaceae bacterium]|jgi:glyoxylate reductase|nr:NAD(P)-dependent oxidoreductase [Candidatus Cloacimonadaceae bacterium]